MFHNVFSKGWSLYSQNLIKRPLITKGLTAATCYTVSDAFIQHANYLQNNSTEKGQYQHDYSRSVKSFIYGVCVLGPTLHYWFRALDKIVPNVKGNSLPLPKIHIDKVPSPFFRKSTNNQLLLSNNGLTRGITNSIVQYSPHTINLQWLTKFSPQRLVWSAKRVLIEQSSYALLMTGVYFISSTTLDFIFDKSLLNQSIGERINAWATTIKSRLTSEYKEYHMNNLKIQPFSTFFNFLLVPPIYRGLALNLFNVGLNVNKWRNSK
ncbi:predicted protein [Naegleria gruberi]|uniref:Predicted protein n=1 Tax=Naegleria gruberi TaxID=5762 RepID=D2VHD2_NAEGR|nr:uncharacterized protein NAEGRDRAFT_68175 [Naegleria gruberi]EFC43867.1 predicted protein [Naegleria gruberi]|eukprot:XP_002676611.1 predicted protein [Naegleria gruberi strain NEG-M]